MGRVAGSDTHYTFALIDHEGNVTDTTIRLPSVSTITKILNKPALVNWAFKLGVEGVMEVGPEGTYKEVYERIKDREGTPNLKMKKGGDRGTDVHSWYEALNNKEATVDQLRKKAKDLPEEQRGYYDALLNWYALEQKDGMLVVRAEEPVVSLKHGFVGTPDLLANRDGVRILTDLKTSKGIYAEHVFQNWGYAIALEELGESVDRVSVLRVGENGQWEERFFDPNPEAFLSLFQTWKNLTDLAERVD